MKFHKRLPVVLARVKEIDPHASKKYPTRDTLHPRHPPLRVTVPAHDPYTIPLIPICSSPYTRCFPATDPTPIDIFTPHFLRTFPLFSPRGSANVPTPTPYFI